MPEIARRGDLTSCHDECRPVSIVTGSPNVFVDGLPVARVGDTCAPHACNRWPNPHPLHTPVIVSGDSSVLVNCLPVAVKGSKVSCFGTLSSVIIGGSPDVSVGG